jgi:hypothetical protein
MNTKTLGKAGKRVWHMWLRKMGHGVSGSDLSEAEATFLMLYGRGKRGKPIGHMEGGMNWGGDETSAHDAGRNDARAERSGS